jgi:hypothetical protein
MMLMTLILDGAAVRFAGSGEAGLCTLGEAIAELLAGYGSTDLDGTSDSDVEALSFEVELVGCNGVPA